jgi:hypothetical protein
MKLLNILYYYYYSFYQKMDAEPHAMTVFALSASQAFAIIFIIQVSASYFFCYFFDTWPMMVIFAAVLTGNYFLFSKSGRAKKIVKAHPPIIISQLITRLFVLLFFLITLSFLFFGPILTKSIRDNCR